MPKTLPPSLERLRDAEILTSTVTRSSAVDVGEIGLHDLRLVYKIDAAANETYEAWTEASFDSVTWWRLSSTDVIRSSGPAVIDIQQVAVGGVFRYFRNAASNLGTGSPELTLDYVIT